MRIQILAKTDTELKFVLEETSHQFANVLRRIMLNEVPVLAVDNVDFYANDSAMYDEVLAHRLGLLPLSFDTKAFDPQETCKCEGKGCSNCQIVLVIDKKGSVMVYAKDIKSADIKTAKPLYPETPIVELFGEQKLKAEMTAILGFGKNHAKWQAARVGYKYYPVAEVKGEIENPEEVVRACPHRALSINGKKVEVSVNCEPGCDAERIAQPKGALKIVGDPNRFVFSVESISGLTAEEIVLSAVDVLKDKAKDFGKQVGKI